jgi:pentatricopeptide repeat protein
VRVDGSWLPKVMHARWVSSSPSWGGSKSKWQQAREHVRGSSLKSLTKDLLAAKSEGAATRQWDAYFAQSPTYYQQPSSSASAASASSSSSSPPVWREHDRGADNVADVVAYNTYMTVLCLKLDETHFRRALAVYHDMRSSGVEPTEATFNILLQGLGRCKDDPHQKKKTMAILLRQMSKTYAIEVTPDKLAWCLAALATGNTGMVQHSLRVEVEQWAQEHLPASDDRAWVLPALLGPLLAPRAKKRLYKDEQVAYLGDILAASKAMGVAVDGKVLTQRLLGVQQVLLDQLSKLNLSSKPDSSFSALHELHDALARVQVVGSVRLLPNPNAHIRSTYMERGAPARGSNVDDRLFAPVLPSPFAEGAGVEEVHVELGFGTGDWMLHHASSTGVGVIGVEKVLARVTQVACQVQQRGLGNAKVYHGLWLDALLTFPAGSVSQIHVGFPSRLPRKASEESERHGIASPELWAAIANCLEPGGKVAIVTDQSSVIDGIGSQLKSNIDLPLRMLAAQELSQELSQAMSEFARFPTRSSQAAREKGGRVRMMMIIRESSTQSPTQSPTEGEK